MLKMKLGRAGLAALALGVLTAAAVQMPAPAAAQTLEFKRNHVKFDQHRYFIRGADSVRMSTYGEKKTPVTEANYLSPQAESGGLGRHDVSGPHTASFASNFSLAHIGSIAVPIKLVNLGIDDAGMMNLTRSGKCRFEHRKVGLAAVKDAIMSNPDAKEFFKQNNDARIVFSVLRVKSCFVETSRVRSYGARGDVNVADYVGVRGLDRAGDEVEVSFKYAKDTVFGYRLAKAKWDKKRKNRRQTIIQMEDDNQGLN